MIQLTGHVVKIYDHLPIVRQFIVVAQNTLDIVKNHIIWTIIRSRFEKQSELESSIPVGGLNAAPYEMMLIFVKSRSVLCVSTNPIRTLSAF